MRFFKGLFVVILVGLLLWSPSAFSITLYNDPSGQEMLDETIHWSFKEMEEKSKGGDLKGEYILAINYMNGSNRRGIKKDKEKAVAMLKDLWGRGVADAGYSLFSIYYNGFGTGDNRKAALDYLKESAEKGYALSQRTLAEAYRGKDYEGLVDKDYDKAMYWYEKAVDNGDKRSAIALASMYYHGEGVEKNNNKTFEWALRCTQLKYGTITAGFSTLAKFYEEGIGTDVDLVQAYKYYDLQGSAGAEGKQRLSKQMTKEQIEEARRQSLEWQKEHNVRIGGGFFQMN
ncbi:tetratricopeptide repeat protein [Salinicola sp. DM10]|uniref:tetratricopeptide repeat protein n=1 Tax=Salinicola sp. DM10 TaxID=2815721 RepID=UPI001E2EABBB|nr:tetratricopeptide repeat protein [Salinicola sp. DM10]MCE3027509.1 sel1 repeat family protein [Salinicola sp. DM10]